MKTDYGRMERTKKKSPKFGYEERQLKSIQRKKQITNLVNLEVEQYLPALLNGTHIEEKKYQNDVSQIMSKLDEQFTKAKDKATARAELAKKINQYNVENKARLAIPTVIISHNPQSTFKNAKWFRNSREAVVCYFEMIRATEVPMAVKTYSKEELLANVLYSAVVHSGVLLEELLEAIKKQLNESDLKLQTSDEYFWLDLEFNSKVFSHNNLVNQKTSVLRRWYIDDVSLGWLNHYLNHPDSIVCKLNVWKLFKTYIPGATKLSSLKSFLEGSVAVLEHNTETCISQAHLNYLIGRIDSSSLPIAAHAFLFGQSTLSEDRNINEISLTDEQPSSSHSKRTSQTGFIHFDCLIDDVNQAFKSVQKGIKPSKKLCLEKLEDIKVKNNDLSADFLLGWLIQVGKDNKVSTIERYWRSIAKSWFIATLDIDLYALDTEDWEELYCQVVAMQGSDKSKQYSSERLSQFHQYLMRIEDIPSIDNSILGLGIGDTALFVRAMFITEDAFSKFLSALQQLNLPETNIQKLLAFYILAFRTGLRRGELIKLRLNDIEESQDMWIFVRNNKFDNNKTSSALRKVPLSVLLTEDERQYFKNFLTQRKFSVGNRNALLFSTQEQYDVPYSGAYVSRVATELLSSIMGQHIIFHHFRHTALSRMQLVLEDLSLALKFTSYNEQQIEDIKEAIGGFKAHASHRDIYWAIAGFAGHLSPQQTFHSYLHFNELIIAQKLRCTNLKFTSRSMHQISGLSKNLITRRTDEQGYITITQLKNDLVKSLQRHIQYNKNSKTNVINNVSQSNVFQAHQIKPTPDLCYQVLKLLEDGGTIEAAHIKFNLPFPLIEKWFNNAIELVTKKTTKNVSRIISQRRKPSPIGLILTPPSLTSNSEKAVMDIYLKEARAYAAQAKSDLQWCIDYFFNHSNTSKQGIIFTDPIEFKRFYNICSEIVREEDFRFELEDIKNKSALSRWATLCKKEITVIKHVSGNVNMPIGKLILSIRHPEEKEMAAKISSQKYSSNSLRYLFHMIYVMV